MAPTIDELRAYLLEIAGEPKQAINARNFECYTAILAILDHHHGHSNQEATVLRKFGVRLMARIADELAAMEKEIEQ